MSTWLDSACCARVYARIALGELTPGQRHALQLRIVDGLAYAEVAARFGVAEPAARARVSRGLRTLGKAFDGNAADFEIRDWV